MSPCVFMYVQVWGRVEAGQRSAFAFFLMIHTVTLRQSLPGIWCFLIRLSKLPTKSRVLSVSASQSWG